MNVVILMGRITKDTELKVTSNGTSVMSFTIAVQRKYKNTNGGYDADFINCVAFGKTAEFIQNYFDKGRLINVIGSMQSRTWNDAQGQKRQSTEVIVNEVNFCGDKPQQSDPLNDVVSALGGTEYISNDLTPVDGSQDDLPF